MINRVLGKCEIQSVIGAGAMAVVYRGHHRALGVPVAIKTIKQELAGNTELVTRFSQEAQLAARLRHPNIVRVLDVDEADGVHFMIMEYLEGRPLDVFHSEGQLADQRVFFSLFYALASAVTRLDFFSLEAAALQSQRTPIVEPPLEPAQAEALAHFLSHALAESGKALDRAFELGAAPILGKYFDEAAAAFPALFFDIQLAEDHTVRAHDLLELVEMLPVTGRRSVVVLGISEVLKGRIQAVRDALPSARKQKRVWKALQDS